MHITKTAKKYLSIFLCMVLLASASAPAVASGWKDKLGTIAEDAGELAKIYLPEIAQEVGLDENKYAVIEKTVTSLLNAEWFKKATLQEKIELVTNLLGTLGVKNTDIIVDIVEKVMSIKIDGQLFAILLEDYAKDLFDNLYWKEDYIDDDVDANSCVNAKAIILYGLGFPQIERALKSSEKAWEKYGLNTSIDNNCTIEDFKHMLSGYDLVILEEHGNFNFMGVPMVVTEERYTAQNAITYASDISAGRIYPAICDKGTIYLIHPDFFRYYYGGNRLSGSIVWLGCCSGAKTSALLDAFLDCGATSVVGHSETVYTAYDYNLMNSSVCRLISGDTVNNALTYAENRWGNSDVSFAREHNFDDVKDTPAYPKLAGNSAAALK